VDIVVAIMPIDSSAAALMEGFFAAGFFACDMMQFPCVCVCLFSLGENLENLQYIRDYFTLSSDNPHKTSQHPHIRYEDKQSLGQVVRASRARARHATLACASRHAPRLAILLRASRARHATRIRWRSIYAPAPASRHAPVTRVSLAALVVGWPHATPRAVFTRLTRPHHATRMTHVTPRVTRKRPRDRPTRPVPPNSGVVVVAPYALYFRSTKTKIP